MTDSTALQIVADCDKYWRAAGIPEATVAEMRAELELHLSEAASRGRPADAVVGPDLATFAESWAREQRSSGERLPTWEEVRAAESRGRRLGAFAMTAVAAAAALATALALAVDEKEEASMDDTIWIWLWLGSAVVFSFGEVVTAGFFMLPFAAGAVVAFVLAIVGVPVGIQWVAFIVISVAALFAVRNFVKHEDEHQPAVGANRYVGARAVVLEDVERHSPTGRVLMDTEDWRATTTGDRLPAGTEVEVTGVTGSRLIVERVEES